MGNSIRGKSKFNDFMETRRNFGCPSGQLVNREPINPDLYMKIGTRVGTIIAYYQHIPPRVTGFKYPSAPSTSSQPCVSAPPKLPELEHLPLIPEAPAYDVPRPKK